VVSYGGRPPRRAEDVRVDPILRPGWISGADRLPNPGEDVYCAEGPAEVVRLLGKTESGRLLELKVADGRRTPFFAAAANILVQPTAPDPAKRVPAPLDESPLASRSTDAVELEAEAEP